MPNNPYIIGITGGSASGKTSFLLDLKTSFKPDEVCIVAQDNYYKPFNEQQADTNGFVNYDLPSCIDIDRFLQDIEKLKNGESITKKEYVFNNPGKVPETIVVESAPIIIVEGLFIYYFEQISLQLQLKIFVDADEQIKWQRRLQRDTAERGIENHLVKYQWDNHVKPAYDEYLLPYRNHSDIIIANNINYDRGLVVIQNHIRQVLFNK
ncbi:MAG: uridine-cytidine kinase [Bacteroidota bacterium]|nr:uridine-cytidine kinase [Bacteroidota bacterium]